MVTDYEGGRVNYKGERVDYMSGSLASGGSLASSDYERERIANSSRKEGNRLLATYRVVRSQIPLRCSSSFRACVGPSGQRGTHAPSIM